MNGVHDMGGMHGFGPIEREENEPIFHAVWEAHVRVLMNLSVARGAFNLDAFRYGIERMAPTDYLRASYYERWLASVEYNLIQQGFVTEAEVEARIALLRQQPEAALPSPAVAAPPAPAPAPLPPMTPRFAVGDAVVTRNVHTVGHTRLPRYARGKRGTILLVHGPQALPDSHAHGHGANPEVVYNVRFDGREIWGASAEPGTAISIDLWESYLEPAPV